eukprot:CAMPEP_0178994630 /NCGR_PEP_ID=MMETSP0795-20121207/7377_1 /TAXON_ID=88552 /ORGANISM="Amoebophrya sp., Strain Ameob2" /LENGTH=142 /DNA_ID=CAMNT_0020686845 /DNA_START=356 /DNA_END=784 /DNA_ORIENTATION=+
MIWAEVIHQETRDHMYHNNNSKLEDFQSLEGKEVGVKDFYRPTLEWIKNKYYQAAGQPTEMVKMSRVNRVNPFKQQTSMTTLPSAAPEANKSGPPQMYYNDGRSGAPAPSARSTRSARSGMESARIVARSESVPHMALPRRK